MAWNKQNYGTDKERRIRIAEENTAYLLDFFLV